MYYRKALMLQTYLERRISGGWQPLFLFIFFLTFFLASSLEFSFSFIKLVFELFSDVEAPNSLDVMDIQGYELSPEARAQADLKFTYVVTCQIYGKQKEERKPEAADIALLMQRWNILTSMLYNTFTVIRF